MKGRLDHHWQVNSEGNSARDREIETQRQPNALPVSEIVNIYVFKFKYGHVDPNRVHL